jgi:hypothetical protein
MAIIELFAYNSLEVTQELDTNIKGFTIEHRLALNSIVISSLSYNAIAQRIWLKHVVTVNKVLNLTTGNVFAFSQDTHPRSFNLPAYTGFIYWHDVIAHKATPVKNVLTISQSAIAILVPYNPIDIFTIEQIVNRQFIKNGNFEQQLNLTHGASVHKPSASFIGPIEDV